MREGWDRIRLGELSQQVVEPVPLDGGTHYQTLGVKWYAEGTFLREPKLGSEIKASRLFRVRPGQFVYNRMFATEGSFAVVRPEDKGAVASNEFPVFDLDNDRLLVEYLQIHFQQPEVWAEVSRQCTGTTKSRLRWKEVLFSAYEIALPPVAEQRRIVDLIGALDEVVEVAIRGASRAKVALRELLAIRLGGTDEVSLDSLVRYSIGGAWGSPPGEEAVDVIALGPRAYADGRTSIDARTGQTRSLSLKRADARFTNPGDILLERSGGGPTQPVGRVIRAIPEGDRVVGSDFQRLLRPDPDLVHPDYLFWRMWSIYESGGTVTFQSATTGIRNLNIGNYLRSTRIPLPDMGKQAEIAGIANSFNSVIASSAAYAGKARQLRSTLLTALLSGEHEIPELYDGLMGL